MTSDTQAQTSPTSSAKFALPTHAYRDTNDSNRHAITIGKTPSEVFNFWRKLENLPQFMKDLASVNQTTSTTSHWKIKLNNGLETEWDAEIIEERPGRMIAWQSVPGSEMETKGIVWFYPATANLGTVVSLSIEYQVPGGKLTELLTRFTGEDPEVLIMTNLKRLKGLLETGVLATIEGQSSGRDEDQEKSVTLN